MIIEVKGASFDNIGACLMLTAVIQRLEFMTPDAVIVLSARGAMSSERRARLGALRKIDLRARRLDLNGATGLIPSFIRRHLQRWGVVLECDLDAIIDIAGFGYSDQWGSDYAIRHAAAEARRLATSGRHYIFMPQAFGPFRSKKTRDVIRRNLPFASLVAARDKVSYQHIADITDEFSNLVTFGDFTNSIAVIDAKLEKPPRPYMVIVPNANMMAMHNLNSAWRMTYRQLLSSAVTAAEEVGLATVLINFGGPMDQELIDELHTEFPETILAKVQSAAEAKTLMASAVVALSSRFHACICALSSGVPCMGTSWSHKYEALYQDYGVTDLLLTPSHRADELKDLLGVLVAPTSEVRKEIASRALSLKAETETLWKTVETVLIR